MRGVPVAFVRLIVHATAPIVVAAVPLRVVVVTLPCGPARMVLATRLINSWEPLHPREVVVKLATNQVGVIIEDPSNRRGDNISKPGLRGMVDAGSKAMKTKMRGKVTVIKLLPKRVYMR
jgi:hypothetical protein